MAGLFDGDLAQGHSLLLFVADVFEELRPLVLDILEALPYGVAGDDRVDLVVGLLAEGDVDRVGVAEKVAQVPQDLLVGPDQGNRW
jgi:hypothetical protein